MSDPKIGGKPERPELYAPAVEPDFQQLGRETLWSAQEWREAWDWLDEPRLWPTLCDLVQATWGHPIHMAQNLRAAMVEPLGRDDLGSGT